MPPPPRLARLLLALLLAISPRLGAAPAEKTDAVPAIQQAFLEGRLDQAQTLAEKWLAASLKVPVNAARAANARQWLGQILDARGEHDRAAAELQQALAAYEKAKAAPVDLASCAEAAALACHAAGRLVEADALFHRALDWLAKTPGDATTDLPRVRLNHAVLLIKFARLEEADRLLAAIAAEAPASLDPLVLATALHQTGLLRQAAGSYAEAAGAFSRAHALFSAAQPPQPANTAAVENDWGLALLRAGQFDEAATRLESARRTLAALPPPGAPAASLLACTSNLAGLHLSRHQPQAAWDALDPAIRQARKGPALSPPTLLLPPLNNLGVAAWELKHLEDAAAAFAEAATLAASLEPFHPLRSQIALNSAAVAAARSRDDEARTLARQASQLARQWLAAAATSGSEDRLLALDRTCDPVSPLACFAATTPEDIEALAQAVVGSKDAAFDQLLSLRRWTSTLSPADADAWQTATAAVQQALLARGPDSPDLAAARTALDALRRRLPAAPARAAADWKSIRDQLPPGAVFIDYVIHRNRPADAGDWPRACSALVLRQGEAPRWVPLGPAQPVEENIRATLAKANLTTAAAAYEGRRLASHLSLLWRQVWSPVAAAVGGATRIIVRADGLLHFIPWAVLVDPAAAPDSATAFFCQSHPQFELTAFPRPAAARKSGAAPPHWRVLAVPAAPAGDKAPALSTPRPPLTPALLKTLAQMPALPGVEAELTAIRAAAATAGVEKITFDSPRPATESASLPAAAAPDVLHFATHAFAQPDAAPDDAASLAWGVDLTRDPWSLYRSGLVLADCAKGLAAAASGSPLPAASDGLLFTADIARMPLDSTRLVFLSACQTGLGRPEPGGHLAALRRAFLLSGAAAVTSSLWDVDDARAPATIGAFYTRFAAGDSPAQALWSTQHAWLSAPVAAALPLDQRVSAIGSWLVESAGWQP